MSAKDQIDTQRSHVLNYPTHSQGALVADDSYALCTGWVVWSAVARHRFGLPRLDAALTPIDNILFSVLRLQS